jgi:hypothetical protein
MSYRKRELPMLNAKSIRKYFKFMPALIFMAYYPVILAQEVTVKAQLDTNSALIGDQLKLFLSVETPADVRIKFPGLKDTITRKIEIVGDSYTDTTHVSGNKVTFGRNLLITVFDTGFFEIPSLEFTTVSGQLSDTVSTLPLHFVVLPVPADTTLRDIKRNFKAPVNLAEILYYVKEDYPYGLLLIGIGLAAWFTVRYIRKRRKRGKDIPAEVPGELPEVTALRELERINEEKPWLHNKVKHYYIRLSDVLRHYVEGRYKIMALEQTTDEILASLKLTPCDASDLSNLSNVLKLADLVKFAKVIPAAEENALQVNLATEFVRNSSAPDKDIGQEDDSPKNLVQTKIPTNA